jgi:hypothetical protein
MQRITQKARYEFIHLMETHSPLQKVPLAKFNMTRDMFACRLMRYGATLGRIAENQCNGYQDSQGNWMPRAEARDERKEDRIRARVEELCNMFGCTPVFSGDPRGNVLKIRVPDGYTNDWGREGICVPTS